MYAIYDFVAGPMVWLSACICVGGLLWRVLSLYALAKKKDAMIFSYLSPAYAARSIAAWSIPFYTRSMRTQPVMTAVAFIFHICLFAAPLFLVAHIYMLDEAVGVSWATIPDSVADYMTLAVLACCVFFAIRRVTDRTTKYVTDWTDFALLALVAAPFLTGYFAFHQMGDYMTMLILHIVSAELVLIAIPFTRLSHMVLAPMVRGYMGSEFGGVRHTKDW